MTLTMDVAVYVRKGSINELLGIKAGLEPVHTKNSLLTEPQQH